MWDEAHLVAERIKGQLATIGVLIQSATATTGMSAGQKALSSFKKLIKGLSGE